MEPLVVPYDARWPTLFAEEAELVAAALGPRCLGVEHIGSTAVAGLSSKPVVDLLVGLPDPLSSEDTRALRDLGYTRLRARRDGRLVFRKGTPREYSLHVAELGTSVWLRPLVFRDHLRAWPEEAERYARLKLELARAGSRSGYADGKAAFIDDKHRELARLRTIAERRK